MAVPSGKSARLGKIFSSIKRFYILNKIHIFDKGCSSCGNLCLIKVDTDIS